MPLFTTLQDGKRCWVPSGNVLFLEEGAGRLTTVAHFLLPTPKGFQPGLLEVEGTVASHAEKLDNPLRGIVAAPVEQIASNPNG